MERIGEKLRRRREELGLTLEDVSESIRFRPEVIRAIEEGRTGVFPAKAYLSAFLRAYAAVLELDPREIVREQKSEEERAFEAIRSIRMKPQRKRKFPRKALYIAVPIVLAVVLLFVVDRFLWDRTPEMTGGSGEEAASQVPALPARAIDTTGHEPGGAADTGAVESRDSAGDAGETAVSPPEGRGGGASGEVAPGGGPAGERNSSEGPGRDGGRAQDGARGGDSPETTPAETTLPARAGSPVIPPAGDTGSAGRDDDRGDAPGTGGGEGGDREPMVPLADENTPAGAGMETATGSDAEAGTRTAQEPGSEIAGGPGTGTVTEPGTGTSAGAGPERSRHKLVVSARRTAYITLTSGGRNLHDDLFTGGQVDSFFSETPFVIELLTDRGAWTFVQDGERVRLPGSSSEDVSNYEIPLPSGN
jgi:cytoskeleton protein RodZ